ncbi:MAG: hypothetical protein PHH37_04235 [Paludibacter sp.]|nr:hypothetical protein [Paludibacter sp.]
MADYSKEEIAEMISAAVNEAVAPLIERFGETANKETPTEADKPDNGVSEAVKQYVASKKDDLLGGRKVEALNNRNYSPQGEAATDLKATGNSVLTGKEI